jgi:hypothetical protein
MRDVARLRTAEMRYEFRRNSGRTASPEWVMGACQTQITIPHGVAMEAIQQPGRRLTGKVAADDGSAAGRAVVC